jgi:hypothetical protein
MTYQFAIYQLPEDNCNLRDMYFMSPEEIEAISDQYELVATIDAKDPEQAFTIGNMWNEDRMDIVGPMRSVSVGDIVEDLTTGQTLVVAKFGFNEIDMKEGV